MSPAEYREFLALVQIASIDMDSCSVRTRRENAGDNMNVDVVHKTAYLIEEEIHAEILSKYDLTITRTTKKDYALKIKCEYRVVLFAEKAFSEAFLDIFTDINIQPATWPYFREFAQNMIMRTGFPPFTLPLLKSTGPR